MFLVGCAGPLASPMSSATDGGSPTPAGGLTEAEKVYAELGPGSGAERLVGAAQEEGELTIYGGANRWLVSSIG